MRTADRPFADGRCATNVADTVERDVGHAGTDDGGSECKSVSYIAAFAGR
jgi:hypothetical protein